MKRKNKEQQKITKNSGKIVYAIAIMLLIIWTFRIDLINMDDTFTLRMLHHSILEIVRLDSLDVHPPLYYIVLKIFFNATFVIHASPYIQIIMGRLFNALIFIITLNVMRDVLSKLTYQRFSFMFLFLVILFPTVVWHSTGIRMYSLSALFIACELNAIINYNQKQHLKDLVFATIFAALGAWTHYFTAVIAGLLLFYNFIAEKHKRLHYLISGVAFFLLFVPWLKVLMQQITSVKQHYWIKNCPEEYFGAFIYRKLADVLNGGFLACCFSVFFLICLTYIAFKTLKNFCFEFRKYYVMITIILFGTIFIGLMLSILVRPIFEGRYVYGISLIYFVMNLPLIAEYFTSRTENKTSIFIKSCMLILICVGVMTNLLFGVFYDLKGVKIYRNMQQIRYSSEKVIDSSHDPSAVALMDSFLVQNKTFTTKNYRELSNTCQSMRLFKIIYPNIENSYKR